jgi:hypothetical protein
MVQQGFQHGDRRRATAGHEAVPQQSDDEAAEAVDQTIGMEFQQQADAELIDAEVAQKLRFMG